MFSASKAQNDQNERDDILKYIYTNVNHQRIATHIGLLFGAILKLQ